MPQNPLLEAIRSGRPRRRSNGEQVPLEEDIDPSVLGVVGKSALSGLARVGNLLDLPGSVVRESISYLGGNTEANPFDQLLPWNWTTDEGRISGRDLLREQGFVGQEDTWGNYFGGLAAEIALDPTTYATFGAGALTKAGRVARAAGIKNAAKITGSGLGRRLAGMTTTLGDVFSHAPQGLRNALTEAAQKSGSSIDDLIDQPLSSLFHVGIPGTEIGVNIGSGKGSQAIAGLMDLAGKAASESLPGRFTNMLFDYTAKGQLGKAAQTLARVMTEQEPAALKASRELIQKFGEPFQESLKNFDELFGADIRAGALNKVPGMEELADKNVESVFNRALTTMTELVGDDGTKWAETAKLLNLPSERLTPELRGKILQIGSDMKSQQNDLYQSLLEMGSPGKVMGSLPSDFVKVEGPHRDRVIAMAKQVFPDSADASIALMDARAQAWSRVTGKKPGDWYERIKDIREGEAAQVSAQALFQESPQAPIFYSKLFDEMLGLKGKMGWDQLKSTLKNKGVKDEEIVDSGLEAFMKGKKSVSQEDILNHLNDSGAIEVEDVVKGTPTEKDIARYRELDSRTDRLSDAEIGEWNDIGRAMAGRDGGSTVKFGPRTHPTMSLPGGQNYREVLIKLRNRSPNSYDDFAGKMEKKYGQGYDVSQLTPEESATQNRLWNELMSGGSGKMTENDFRSSHWNEPNVLAHVRLNDRVIDGKKTLFIEEIQSDWHQQGRKRGYQTQAKAASQNPIVVMARNLQAGDVSRAEAAHLIPEEVAVLLQNGEISVEDGARRLGVPDAENVPGWPFDAAPSVPDAPFKKSWSQLAMKRMIRWAAENGYEKVAWTPGAVQADRYNLANHVDNIGWQTAKEGERGYRAGDRVVHITPKNSGVIELSVEPASGKVVSGLGSGADTMVGKRLDEIIGKDHADNILSQVEGSVSGEGLSIGGEGMKGFYDNILVNDTNKYIKKWGARVGQAGMGRDILPVMKQLAAGEISESEAVGLLGVQPQTGILRDVQRGWMTPESAAKLKIFTGGSDSVHSFDVTDAMKKEVLEKGQPLYQKGRGAVEFDKDNKAIITAFKAADTSTLAHETGHIFRRDLAESQPDLLARAEKELGVLDGKWDRNSEELFAKGFENYLATEAAPTEGLKAVFSQFKQWLLTLYRSIVGTPLAGNMTPELKKVFDEMLGGGAAAGAPGIEHLYRQGADRGLSLGGAIKRAFEPAGFTKAREKVFRNVPPEVANQIQVSDRYRGKVVVDAPGAAPSAGGRPSDQLMYKRTPGAAKRLVEDHGKWLGRDFEEITDPKTGAVTKKKIWKSKLEHAEAIIDHIKSGAQEPIYNTNAIENHSRYLQEGFVKAANYKVIHKTVGDNLTFGDPMSVPLREVFSAAKMEPEQAINYLASQTGKTVDELADAGIPEDIANAIKNIQLGQNDPEWMQRIGNLIDIGTKLFKENVTLPFPSFWLRNLVSGQYVNAVSGEMHTPADFGLYGQQMGRAKNILATKDQASISELLANGVIDPRMVSEGVEATSGAGFGLGTVPDPLQVGKTWEEAGSRLQPFKTQALNNPLLNTVRQAHGALLDTGSKASQQVEFYNRVPMYYYLREKGWTPEAAARKVQELQVDYTAMSPFEKSVMKRLAPFYCVPDDTLILTRDGWRTCDQLVIGVDEVLTYSCERQQLEWQKPTANNIFPFDGELTTLHSNRVHLRCTDDHKWAVKKPKFNKTWQDPQLVPANKISKGQQIVIAAEIAAGGESCMTPEQARLVGWIVTDGYFRRRGGGTEAIIYQSPKKFLDEVIAVAGGKPRKPHPQTGVVAVPVLRSRLAEVARFLNKDLLSIHVTRLNKEAAEAMWDAMYKADGGTAASRSSDHLACQHPGVREAARILAAMLGKRTSLSRNGDNITGIHVSSRQILKTAHLVKGKEQYSGRVWCPTTPNGTWVMKQGEFITITGNTWQRRMAPTILGILAERPGGYMGQTIRASRLASGEDAMTPEHVAETLAIPSPFGVSESGTQAFVTGFGLPYEQFGKYAAGPQAALFEALGQLNPPLKGLIEYGTGHSLFQSGPSGGGRALEELDPPVGRLISNLARKTGLTTSREPDYLPQEVEQIASASPLSRYITTARQLTDERKTLADKALNFLTGVKVTSVSPEAMERAVQLRSAEVMKQMGGREFKRPYFSKDQKTAMNPASRELAEKLEQLQSTIVERRQERAGTR